MSTVLRALGLLLLATRGRAGQNESSAEIDRGPNVQWAEQLLLDVRLTSFPRLTNTDVRLRTFHSQSDYFQARFSILHFFFARRMQYVVRVNGRPVIRTAPAGGDRAILAHELAHVQYYVSGNRIHLFALIRLGNARHRRKFERQADLEAIQLGYAQGLKNYRLWLYQHVSAKAFFEKKRSMRPLAPLLIPVRQRADES
jgi:hypothetical protein